MMDLSEIELHLVVQHMAQARGLLDAQGVPAALAELARHREERRKFAEGDMWPERTV